MSLIPLAYTIAAVVPEAYDVGRADSFLIRVQASVLFSWERF